MTARPDIFVFCRPYIVAEFRANFAPLSDEYHFHFMADGKCPGTDDTRSGFYGRLAAGAICAELSEDEVEDIRDRCRLLRNLKPQRAVAMIHAMAGTLAERLDGLKPAVVVCHLIDEYILHTLSILAAHRGIPVLAYCASYFSGRALTLQNAYGIAHRSRSVDDAEVETSLAAISAPAFRQDYRNSTVYSRGRHGKLVLRYYAKRLAYTLKGIIENDRSNMHYLIGPYTADRRRFSDYPDLAKFDDWQAKLATLRQQGRRQSVYMPLGYYPEATTNYWIGNRSMLDYDGQSLRLARALSDAGFAVVIKEHVHMLGMRDPALYAALKAIDGVALVPPAENSNGVLSHCDAMLIGSGSGGVEATIRGKPVVTFCNTSYWYEASGAAFLDLDDERGWAETIGTAIRDHKPMGEPQKRTFIRACLQGTVRTRPGGGVFPHLDLDDMRALLGRLADLG